MMYFENREGDTVVRDSIDEIGRYLDLFAELKKRLPGPDETNQQLDSIIQLMKERANGIIWSGQRKARYARASA
jgi:hypothetical protein